MPTNHHNDSTGRDTFHNRVALVTGANSGIGLAVAEQLEAQGARVIRVDIQGEHKPPWYYVADLSQPEEIDRLIQQTTHAVDRIDLLAHAAGVLKTGVLLEYSIEDWQSTFNVNALGTFYLCQQVGRHMAQKKQGAIVLVGSNSANTPRLTIGAYAASKAASHQMIKCLGLELAEFGVRCNIVAPGSTDTAMQHMLWQNPDDKQHVIAGNSKEFRLGIPLHKIATPLEISAAICFLLSDHASHITLQTLTVDGGATLGCSN